jgi:hypothetical protein
LFYFAEKEPFAFDSLQPKVYGFSDTQTDLLRIEDRIDLPVKPRFLRELKHTNKNGRFHLQVRYEIQNSSENL